MNTTTAGAGSATVTDHSPSRPLSRPAEGAMLAGVAAGLARYLDADVTLVRIIMVALFLITGSGAALYIAAWLLIPRDGQDQSIAARWLAGRRGQSR
jgi:phage shock protein PspC (stress-responsive transcriptional regulator)